MSANDPLADPAPVTNQPSASDVASMATGLNTLQMFAEGTIGYYTKLVNGGVPVESAARMAEQFHAILMANAMKSAGLKS